MGYYRVFENYQSHLGLSRQLNKLTGYPGMSDGQLLSIHGGETLGRPSNLHRRASAYRAVSQNATAG